MITSEQESVLELPNDPQRLRQFEESADEVKVVHFGGLDNEQFRGRLDLRTRVSVEALRILRERKRLTLSDLHRRFPHPLHHDDVRGAFSDVASLILNGRKINFRRRTSKGSR